MLQTTIGTSDSPQMGCPRREHAHFEDLAIDTKHLDTIAERMMLKTGFEAVS